MFGRAPHWDLLVEPDRLHLTDSSTGRTCTARAAEPFSWQGALIADRILLEQEFGRLAVALLGRKPFFRYPPLHVSTNPSTITAVEREALRTALLNAGCRKVIFEGLN